MKKPTLDDGRLISFHVGVALGVCNVLGNGVLLALGGSFPVNGLLMLAAGLLAYGTINHEARYRVQIARLVHRRDKSKVELEIAERMVVEMRKAAGIVVHTEPQGPTH